MRRFHAGGSFAHLQEMFVKQGLLALLLVAMPALLQAQEQEHVTIARTIPCVSDAVGNAAVRAECDWNTRLSNNVTSAAHGQVSVTDQDLAAVAGSVLTN